MKTILNTIKTLLLTGVITILASFPVMADTTLNTLQETNTTIKADNSIITDYTDGSFAYMDKVNNKYEFTANCLGDWDIQADNKEDLNNIVSIYKSHIDNAKDLCNTIKDIKEINRYTDDTGLTTIEYNNGSFALYNTTTGLYQFTPTETLVTSQEGYCVQCKDIKQLNNCIATYKSIKLTGKY